ncbi:MAG: SpoIIAA family protein [Minisyncoccota bacterium]
MNAHIAEKPLTENIVACDQGVLRYRLLGSVDEKEAERLDTVGREYLDRGEASAVLIDMQHSNDFSSAARRRWVGFLQHPAIRCTAIFGGNVFVRTLAAFVMGASQKKNIKFFATEKEALAWIETKESAV